MLIRSFLLIALVLVATRGHTVNSHPPATTENAELSVKQPKKIGVVKKWLIKRLAKKIKKQLKDIDTEDLSLIKKARLSLTFGLISFVLLFVGLIAPWLWIVAALAAILGDVFSILTLRKTRDNKKQYNRERKVATWGLVLSLLTGVIPLLLLLLVFLSL